MFRTFATVLVMLVSTQVACSSADKTCSATEDQACTKTYNDCITQAAAAADKVACQKCVDDYCSCYNACGSTCDKQRLSTACQ